jgi:hypothetical protein
MQPAARPPTHPPTRARPSGCHDELSGAGALEVAERMADWMLKKAAAADAAKAKGKTRAVGAGGAAAAAGGADRDV